MIGGLIGLGMTLPMRLLPASKPYHTGISWSDVPRVLLAAPTPGLRFAAEKGLSGMLVNALIWSGTWMEWRSQNRHMSAKIAKVITAACWCVWLPVTTLSYAARSG